MRKGDNFGHIHGDQSPPSNPSFGRVLDHFSTDYGVLQLTKNCYFSNIFGFLQIYHFLKLSKNRDSSPKDNNYRFRFHKKSQLFEKCENNEIL